MHAFFIAHGFPFVDIVTDNFLYVLVGNRIVNQIVKVLEYLLLISHFLLIKPVKFNLLQNEDQGLRIKIREIIF
jgi:hypothetical protein